MAENTSGGGGNAGLAFIVGGLLVVVAIVAWFVFGRGGEEAIALGDAGISWTYTPGITAALGGLASAGIPPTHRGVADSVTLATGRKGGAGGADPDLWRPLGAIGGTKAVYMGASSWRQVASLLRGGGMPDDAPCAAVTWAHSWPTPRRR